MFIRLAPLLFVLLWSSSFIGAKIGLRHVTPLLFVAVRLVGCAIVLLAAMAVLRRSWRPLAGWKWLHCAVAAQIALVQSLTPLLASVFGVAILHERLRSKQWSGLALGFAGVGLVVGQAALESATRFEGLALAFVGVIGLVSGTLYFGRFCRGVPLLPGATAQFVSAAIVSATGAWLLETPHADWTGPTIMSTAWNTIMVSLGGMGLYFVMLTRGSAARTTSNFYLVPGTAAVLAWVTIGERLSPLAIAGLVVASAGCWLVNAAPARI